MFLDVLVSLALHTDAVAPPHPTPVVQQAPQWTCDDVHARRLYRVGFRGKNHREAWAILMRESGGRPNAISATGDYGVFQFNRAAHARQPWWDTERLLTWRYNMQIAYKMSDGGRTWYPWDIDGRGDHLARYTSSGVYGKYQQWYQEYPCKEPPRK